MSGVAAAARAGPFAGLRARYDALIADRRFQDWASAFPLTRPIARRRARALFDLCAGFVYAQVLTACVELNLFAMLRAGPLPAAEIARRAGLPIEPAERLLAAAASLRLLSARRGAEGHGWGLGALGAAMLGNPGIAAMVRHHALLYADLADPVALLRGGGGQGALARYWAYAREEAPGSLPDARTADYTALMAASQAMLASELLDAYPVARHRRLLDVGGGDGGFALAAAARAPALEVAVFDLPSVAARATARFARAGLGARATAHGGDFRADAWPAGADLISFVRVLHDHNDDVVRALLRAARAALPPGGTVLVAEPMADAPGAAPVGDAYFGLYLLAMGQGRPRSPSVLRAMLREAGFDAPRLHRTRLPMIGQVLTALAPSRL